MHDFRAIALSLILVLLSISSPFLMEASCRSAHRPGGDPCQLESGGGGHHATSPVHLPCPSCHLDLIVPLGVLLAVALPYLMRLGPSDPRPETPYLPPPLRPPRPYTA